MYASSTTTEYRYDPLSFRLTEFETTRTSDDATLQKTTYYYDAVGNIVQTVDGMDEDVYFSTTPSPSADQDFTYDAVYRLIEATGREHGGTVEDTQYDDQDFPIHPVPHPNSPNGFRAYTQEWTYDKIGNITQFKHLAGPSNSAGWTRDYTYGTGDDNRLTQTTHSGGNKSYTHDVGRRSRSRWSTGAPSRPCCRGAPPRRGHERPGRLLRI